MDKSLIDYLKQIPDSRDAHGLRHPLWLVLLIIIMGMMSGYWGYRQLGRFVERHRRELVLGVKMMENKEESEINVVRDLIELLDLTGVVFTFDALHCPKSGCEPASA